MNFFSRFKNVFLPVAATEFHRLRAGADFDAVAEGNGNVIVLPFRLSPDAQWFEFVVAYALRMRGYNPIVGMGERAVSYTDGYLCTTSRWRNRWISLWRAKVFARAFAMDLCQFDKLLGKHTLERLRREAHEVNAADIPDYEKYGIHVGSQVMGSLSRYYLRCRVAPEEHRDIAREFLFTALVSMEAARILVDRYDPRLLISSHGIYASWGTFCDYFRSKNIPFVTWGFQYKQHSFIFSHNKSYHRDMIEASPTEWRGHELDSFETTELIHYIKGKKRGNSDTISYYVSETHRENKVRARLGIGADVPVFGMFPNLGWDAQVSFKTLFFDDMNEWILATIDWFARHPHKVLIIRAHPAELRGTAETQEKVVDVVARGYPKRPENVFLIAPDSDLTSYDVLAEADVCLVYGSKFGLEAALERKPLIVCGEAYFRDKGLSFDPDTALEYFGLLHKAPDGTVVTDEMYEVALRFGHYYYVQRQYQLPLAVMRGTTFRSYALRSLTELAPGSNPALDRFFASCFSGEPFVNIPFSAQAQERTSAAQT